METAGRCVHLQRQLSTISVSSTPAAAKHMTRNPRELFIRINQLNMLKYKLMMTNSGYNTPVLV